MHFLQVQNPNGLFSNDFIFHVSADGARPKEDSGGDLDQQATALSEAIARGNLSQTKRLTRNKALINKADPRSGMPPLSTAAYHGHLEIVRHLIKNGARVSGSNRDGNTPLHLAAFLCREDIVEVLLDNGASRDKRNQRQETAIDVVAAGWSDQLAGFYHGLSTQSQLGLDLKEIEKQRPRIAKLLRNHKYD